jgi:hypothetical protein
MLLSHEIDALRESLTFESTGTVSMHRKGKVRRFRRGRRTWRTCEGLPGKLGDPMSSLKHMPEEKGEPAKQHPADIEQIAA